MREVPQRVLALLAPHYLATHQDGSPRYAMTRAFLGTHVRIAAQAAAQHLDPTALLQQLFTVAAEMGAHPQQVNMVTLVADLVEGTEATEVAGTQSSWGCVEPLVWPLRTMSSVHGIRQCHTWPTHPVSSAAASAILDTIPDRVKAMLMPGALPAALANVRVAAMALESAGVSDMSGPEYDHWMHAVGSSLSGYGPHAAGMLFGLAKASGASGFSTESRGKRLMCNIMGMTRPDSMLQGADPFFQLWPFSMPGAADAVIQELVMPAMINAGCGPGPIVRNISPGTHVRGLVWTQDSFMRKPVVLLQVSHGGNTISAPFWVSKDQAGTTLSSSTCRALGLETAEPDVVHTASEPAFKVKIHGADELASMAALPDDNVNVLGTQTTAAGSRRWRWCVEVRGNSVSVWAEQDPAWRQASAH